MKKLLFGVEVEVPPANWSIENVTDNQAETLANNCEWKGVAPHVWPSVCQAILKEAGCPGKLDKYRASIIIGFLKSATPVDYKKAENAGFADSGGQKELF